MQRTSCEKVRKMSYMMITILGLSTAETIRNKGTYQATPSTGHLMGLNNVNDLEPNYAWNWKTYISTNRLKSWNVPMSNIRRNCSRYVWLFVRTDYAVLDRFGFITRWDPFPLFVHKRPQNWRLSRAIFSAIAERENTVFSPIHNKILASTADSYCRSGIRSTGQRWFG